MPDSHPWLFLLAGDLYRKRGNDRYREPVCQPQSMTMPTETVEKEEWNEDWYVTWQSRKDLHGRAPEGSEMEESCFDDTDFEGDTDDSFSSDGSETMDSNSSGEDVYSNNSNSEEEEDDAGPSWEEAPECGTFRNVRQKIGEHVSRVHPNHTSFLRRSRWRKKHFPRGSFPY